MSYYRICPCCGAHLDPGERCDCWDNEKTAASSAKADDGKVEQNLPLFPPPMIHEKEDIFKHGTR